MALLEKLALTPRQKQYIENIKVFHNAHNRWPTRSEVAKMHDTNIKNAKLLLIKLDGKGYISNTTKEVKLV